MKARCLVLLAALALAGGCTTTVTGTPSPVRGSANPASTSPCSLLTADEAESLGLQSAGVAKPAQPQLRTPPSCTWSSANPDAVYDGSLQVFYSTGGPIQEYYSTAPTKVERLGGLEWSRYPNPVGDFICDLVVKLSDTSFVAVSSQNLANPAQSCALAEKAAPVVARHLPG